MSINLLIANASGSLDRYIDVINRAFDKACLNVMQDLNANAVDIVVVDASYNTIPEIGVGGYTPSAHLVYMSLDPTHDIKEIDIYSGMLHEIHHALRWRNPGYGMTLEEALYTEGLAALYEEEATNIRPIYTQVKLTDHQINQAKKNLKAPSYNHQMWFISGNHEIPRWFGYSYGYQLAKAASVKHGQSASELVHTSVDKLR